MYIANQYNSCYHGYNAMISMTIIILKKPMMSSKSSPPTRWWWWRRRHGTASGRHGAIYIHSSIRYTYTALVSSFSSLLLVSNKPLYSWTLTSHWPVWLAARRRISWLRSSYLGRGARRRRRSGSWRRLAPGRGKCSSRRRKAAMPQEADPCFVCKLQYFLFFFLSLLLQ